MRIITANLNGVRSAANKGFFEWMLQQQADVICVQELKAQQADMSALMLAPPGYHGYFHYAEKRGYSGVGIYSRREPDLLQIGIGCDEFDAEGRYVRADFGILTVISLYLPSGSSSEERQQAKFRFMEMFWPHLQQLAASGRQLLICGDWNIAHQPLDLKNWKGNLKNSGFLPEERAWIGRVLGELGYVDLWRRLYPEVPGYTWWSNRGQAYAKDVGWRIDYQLASSGLAAHATAAHVFKEIKFSDHAPLSIDFTIDLPASGQESL